MPAPLTPDELAARRAAPYTGQMRKSRAKNKESGTVAGRPRCPEYLSDAAKSKFKQLVRHLSQRGVLTPGDSELLEQYCVIHARWLQVAAEVAKVGPIIECGITNNSGEVTYVRRESPASKVSSKLETQLRQLLRELTLTVSSREKAKPVKQPSPKDEPGSLGWYMNQLEEKDDNENPNATMGSGPAEPRTDSDPSGPKAD